MMYLLLRDMQQPDAGTQLSQILPALSEILGKNLKELVQESSPQIQMMIDLQISVIINNCHLLSFRLAMLSIHNTYIVTTPLSRAIRKISLFFICNVLDNIFHQPR